MQGKPTVKMGGSLVIVILMLIKMQRMAMKVITYPRMSTGITFDPDFVAVMKMATTVVLSTDNMPMANTLSLRMS